MKINVIFLVCIWKWTLFPRTFSSFSTLFVSLQEFWWTGRVSTSTSSWPAVPSLPPPQYSFLCLSAYWTEKRGILRRSLSRAHCLSKAGRPLAWLQAASTAVCQQRATKRKPQLMGPSTSPASKSCSRISPGCFPKCVTLRKSFCHVCTRSVIVPLVHNAVHRGSHAHNHNRLLQMSCSISDLETNSVVQGLQERFDNIKTC